MSQKVPNADWLVIGGGLTGLLITHLLRKKGQKTLLLEANPYLGGKSASTANTDQLENGLQYWPQRDDVTQLLAWLGEEVPLRCTTRDNASVTFDNGKLIPFVGFGDQTFAAMDELSFYNHGSLLVANCEPSVWVNELTKHDSEQVALQSEVTDIVVEDQQVTHVIVNGNKTYQAQKYLFCLPPHRLADFLMTAGLNHKALQKLSKTPLLSSIQLHFRHSQIVTEQLDLHYLMGAKTEPVMGRFFPPDVAEADGSQASLWLSLVPREMAEDSEWTSGVIKNIKKQIKRAYPNALHNVRAEKIVVWPEWGGRTSFSANPFGSLPGLTNAHFCHRTLTSWPDPWLGAIAAARDFINVCFSQAGCSPQ